MIGTFNLWEDYFCDLECNKIFSECETISRDKLLIPDIVKTKRTKRSSRGFSDPGYSYDYKGASHIGLSWPLWLREIRDRLAILFDQPFEFALLTEFPKGASLGNHNDKEQAIVAKSKIVCISVGAV